MKFTTAAAVGAYLPAGGPPDSLDVDLVNPSSSNSSVFGGQVLALQINVDFSAQNITGNGPIGALVLCNVGVTVNQVLADANTVLGGGALPSYVTSISDLNDLADNSGQPQQRLRQLDGHRLAGSQSLPAIGWQTSVL